MSETVAVPCKLEIALIGFGKYLQQRKIGLQQRKIGRGYLVTALDLLTARLLTTSVHRGAFAPQHAEKGATIMYCGDKILQLATSSGASNK
jgi:hypothetical protein